MSDRLKLLIAIAMVGSGLLLCGVSATWIDLPTRAVVSDEGLTEDAPGFDPADFPVITGTSEVDTDPSQLPTIAPKPAASSTSAIRPTERPAGPAAVASRTPTATARPSATPRPAVALPPLPDTLNIVLLGSDHRPGAPTR